MRTLLTVLTAVLAVGAGRAADDDAAKAKAVVEKAVKAAGWETLGANVSKTWTDKGALHIGGQKLEYTGEWWFSGPDKYRFVAKLNFGGTDVSVTAVTNGDKAWQSDGNQTEAITGDKLEYTVQQVYSQWVYTLTPLLTEKGFTLKPVAGVKVDGAETTGVEVTHKGRPAVKLYFDAKTGLLAKAETTVKNEFDGWKETTDEVTFADWKAGEDKKKFPSKTTVTRGGTLLIETEASNHKFVEKLEAKLFDELK
jgi:outer membrane lipoprotein-sorting protein